MMVLSGCVFSARYEISDRPRVSESRIYYGQSFMEDVKGYKDAE